MWHTGRHVGKAYTGNSGNFPYLKHLRQNIREPQWLEKDVMLAR